MSALYWCVSTDIDFQNPNKLYRATAERVLLLSHNIAVIVTSNIIMSNTPLKGVNCSYMTKSYVTLFSIAVCVANNRRNAAVAAQLQKQRSSHWLISSNAALQQSIAISPGK